MSDTASGLDRPRGGKGREAFRTISEVADLLDLPQHVLRFWESKFSQIKPLKRGGNRRYYRPDDVTLLKAIKKLLHADGYTIRGVQKLFKAQGVKTTVQQALDLTDEVEAAPRSDDPVYDPARDAADEPASAPDPEPVAVPVVQEGGTMSASDIDMVAAVLFSLKRLRSSLD